MTLIDSRPGIKAAYQELHGQDRHLRRRGPRGEPAGAPAGGGDPPLVPRGAGGGDVGPLPRAVSGVRGCRVARPARRPGGPRRGPRGGRPGDRGDGEVRAQRQAAPGAPRPRRGRPRRLPVGGGQGRGAARAPRAGLRRRSHR